MVFAVIHLVIICNVEEGICLKMTDIKYVSKSAPSWQSENRTLIDFVHIADTHY